MFNKFHFFRCHCWKNTDKSAAIVSTLSLFMCPLSFRCRVLKLFFSFFLSQYIHLPRAIMQKPPAYPANNPREANPWKKATAATHTKKKENQFPARNGSAVPRESASYRTAFVKMCLTCIYCWSRCVLQKFLDHLGCLSLSEEFQLPDSDSTSLFKRTKQKKKKTVFPILIKEVNLSSVLISRSETLMLW